MRFVLLIGLAIAFGTLMWGRRDQSHRLVGMWEAVDTPGATTMEYQPNGRCEILIHGMSFYKGKFEFRGSTLQLIGDDGWQSLTDPIWHGENSFTLQFTNWEKPIQFVRHKKS